MLNRLSGYQAIGLQEFYYLHDIFEYQQKRRGKYKYHLCVFFNVFSHGSHTCQFNLSQACYHTKFFIESDTFCKS